MEMKFQIQVVSKEIIKPFSPTPPHLKNHHLCFFDQQAPYLYLQFLYFYNNNSHEFFNGNPHSELLKKTLSLTLARFYPFAGRLNHPLSAVHCNDEGVTFLEARIKCEMSEIINNLKTTSANSRVPDLLFSDNLQGKDQTLNPLLSVQLTHFDCGGIAIAVFLSHKLGDTATFVTFMNYWASITHNSGPHVHLPPVSPRFDAVAFFQPDDNRASEKASMTLKRDEKIVSKRFEFDASQIEKLKAVVSEKMENPTRVQVITALICKAAAAISTSTATTTTLLQTLNLRTRMVAALPETLTGNIISFFVASKTAAEKREIELWRLVAEMKKNLADFCNKYPRKYKTEEWSSLYKLHIEEVMESLSNPPNQTVYACSSWCRFPIYEADFGWGKPTWVTAPVISQKNVIILMDTKDGDGIEALVSLDCEEMAAFDRNIEELRLYHLAI